MKKPLKKYELNQCALYKCRSQRRLEQLLHLEKGQLYRVKDLIVYRSFAQKKKDGSDRIINEPSEKLKKIQRRILYLLSKVQRPQWLISGEKRKCYIDNAKYHMDSTYFLTADISKFYDHCKRERVYRFFKDKMLMSSDIAKIMTDLTTYEGGIPTGCPTSQIIAYYAYEDMFKRLCGIAVQNGCKFTLYVDDITFSSSTPIEPLKLVNLIGYELRRFDHRIKKEKVKYYPKGSFKVVTGVAIKDHRLKVPNGLQKKIYDNFMTLKECNYGCYQIGELDYEKKLNSLMGQLQSAKSIENTKFPEISRTVQFHMTKTRHSKGSTGSAD